MEFLSEVNSNPNSNVSRAATPGSGIPTRLFIRPDTVGSPPPCLNSQRERVASYTSTHQSRGEEEQSNGAGGAAAVVRGGAGGLALPHPEPALRGLPPARVAGAAAPRGGHRGPRARPRRRRRRRALRRARARRLPVLPPGALATLSEPGFGCSNGGLG
jgi:hypothetical protein